MVRAALQQPQPARLAAGPSDLLAAWGSAAFRRFCVPVKTLSGQVRRIAFPSDVVFTVQVLITGSVRLPELLAMFFCDERVMPWPRNRALVSDHAAVPGQEFFHV